MRYIGMGTKIEYLKDVDDDDEDDVDDDFDAKDDL